jgi:ABC-type multidrug transport system fused ATPase/permease subunit
MSPIPSAFDGRGRLLLWVLVGLGFALALLAACAALLIRAWFQQGISDSLLPVLFAAAFAGIGVLTYSLRIAQRSTAERLAQDHALAIRLAVLRAGLQSERLALRPPRSGRALLRFVGELNAIRAWTGNGLARLIVAAVTLPGGIAVLAWLDPGSALAATAIIVALALWALRLAPSIERDQRLLREQQVRMAGRVGEALGQALSVQALGAEERELERLRRSGSAVAEAAVLRRQQSSRLRALPELAAGLMAAVVLWRCAAAGAGTGTLAALLSTLGFIGLALRDLAGVLDLRQSYLVSRERLELALSQPALQVAPRDGAPLQEGAGAVRLDGLSLPGWTQRCALALPGGAVSCIEADASAHPAPLLLAMGGLHDWEAGDIALDGQSLGNLRRQDLRRAVSLLSERVPLMSGRLYRSLAYGIAGLERAEILRRIQGTGLAHWLADYEDGLDQRLREGQRELSRQQRGRLMLLRALLREPRVLLVEAPELLLDAESIEALLREQTRRGFTLIAFTHDARFKAVALRQLRLSAVGLVDASPAAAAAAPGRRPLGDAVAGPSLRRAIDGHTRTSPFVLRTS